MQRSSVPMPSNPARWHRLSFPAHTLTTAGRREVTRTLASSTDGLATGTCMCCDSRLRYPQASTCFRCTVCDTINDLQPLDDPASESRRRRPLTLDRLRRAVEAWRQDRQTAPQLEHLIAESFAQWDRLNASFANGQRTCSTDPGVALDDVREAYRIILELPAPFVRALMQATERLLKRPCCPLRRKDSIRFLLVLLENPLLPQHTFPQETELHHQLSKRMLGLLAGLSNQLHHYLVQWFARLPVALLRQRVDWVSHFITHRLARYHRYPSTLDTIPTAAVPYEADWPLRAAARIMTLLFAANNLRRERLPIADFYNSLVDLVDLTSDYDAWQQRTGKFALCQYPILLSLGAKLQIMRLDARRQMESKVKEALLTTILKKRAAEPYLTLHVRRSCVLEDSLHQLAARETDLKKKLRVSFVGEDGVDAGGLTKEWFLLLLRDLFNPLHSMFVQEDESQAFYFNPASFETTDQYFLAGVIFGLAIYNSIILDVRLPLACYKKLLGVPVGLRDLRDLRPSLARGLQQLLEYPGDDVEELFSLTFAVPTAAYGERRLVPLVPGGAELPVTRANRAEYVARYVRHVLTDAVARQFEPFRRGFFYVCGGNALSLFHPAEIELLVRGSAAALDLDQLRSVTTYHGFTADSPVVEALWALLATWNPARQKRFLAFVTGSDRIPVLGTDKMLFRVVRLGDDCDRFPVARTCFNQLGLYDYASPDRLITKLTRAIDESEGFWLK
ncbi:putative E3 ubiquitin-protein ligase [Tieghemiomyces parasiticus]|uniref:HECT-type E3 ubiquitin transferase n=1 Tax=Tieghemiomyces parasiticus TaxID=78921 RepID=A0A9W7ZQ24_9FUNG|nr:putative E3 ubiquitin-protein ligase [Tieghemiomyces parasiticus]